MNVTLKAMPDSKVLVDEDGNEITVIYSPKLARQLLRDLMDNEKAVIAIDFETTGLFPNRLEPSTGPQVRTTNLCFEDEKAVVLDHYYCGSFASLAEDIAACAPMYVFQATFEHRWFEAVVDQVVTLYDVGHMRRSVLGGGPLSLMTQVKRDLKIDMVKEEQRSDWGMPVLTDSQLIYAGLDAIRTRQLAIHWAGEMTLENWNGFHVINSSVPAVSEMEENGLLLDKVHHAKLTRMWEMRRDVGEAAVRKLVPVSKLANIRSKLQISNLLKELLDPEAIAAWPKTEKTGQLQTTRDIMRQVSYNSPYPFSRFLAAMMVFNRADKYASTYGETMITKATLDPEGRVRGRLNIAQAVTGRFSSSEPNMQNLPKQPLVRRSFVASPGCSLILADYSGIEVRVLAELSGDAQLLHDCIYDDVHARSAIAIYHVLDAEAFMEKIANKDPSAKDKRGKAKVFSFRLTYGAGVPTLAISLRSTLDGAQEALNAWAKRYPKAYGLRQTVFEIMNATGFIHVKSGRSIFVHKRDRSMPVAANYPVQGAAADVMYRACYHVRRLLDASGIQCMMCTTVHDELLLEAPDEYAEEAKGILETGMILGWLDIFPNSNVENLVEAVVGQSWSDKP